MFLLPLTSVEKHKENEKRFVCSFIFPLNNSKGAPSRYAGT